MRKLASVLLVDDDQTTNYLNQRLLQRLAVASEVLVALNGQQALERLLAQWPPSPEPKSALILLDVKMPVMDGFEFMDAYARLPEQQRHAVVVVMLTTSLHPRDMQRLQQRNIAGFLSKPLTAEKVAYVLRTYCA